MITLIDDNDNYFRLLWLTIMTIGCFQVGALQSNRQPRGRRVSLCELTIHHTLIKLSLIIWTLNQHQQIAKTFLIRDVTMLASMCKLKCGRLLREVGTYLEELSTSQILETLFEKFATSQKLSGGWLLSAILGRDGLHKWCPCQQILQVGTEWSAWIK